MWHTSQKWTVIVISALFMMSSCSSGRDVIREAVVCRSIEEKKDNGKITLPVENVETADKNENH
ncbi:MAG: hypothetical protein LE178_02430 [Endomicrobium sp.]|nr:hypothetical protein [Endomicrobium sp.]